MCCFAECFLAAAVVRRKTLLHARVLRSRWRRTGQSRAAGSDEGRTPTQAGHLHRRSRTWKRSAHGTGSSSDRGECAYIRSGPCWCHKAGSLTVPLVCVQHKWKYFNSVSDEAVSHADFMSVLSNVEYIIIKASYGSGLQQSRSVCLDIFLNHSSCHMFHMLLINRWSNYI